jgi:DNA-binding IclR family transcriptional regulator
MEGLFFRAECGIGSTLMAAIKTQTVPALDRALSILEILAQSRAGLTLPELVEQSHLPRSSVHYLLVTLERRGYVCRSERTSRYLFGSKLISLASSAMSRTYMRQVAGPYLQELVNRTRLTAHLGILEQGQAVVIAKCEPLRDNRVTTWVGKRMDVHCTALGKALLAHVDPDATEQIIREHGLPRRNEHTICSVRRLREELTRILRVGYALDDEEDELGSRCIGVPLLAQDRRGLAAISLAGSTSEIDPANVPELAEALKATARAIVSALPPNAGHRIN